MVKYLQTRRMQDLTDELVIILCCTERARKFPRTVCNCFDSTENPLNVSNNEIRRKGKFSGTKGLENNTGFVENLFYKLLVATQSALKAV